MSANVRTIGQIAGLRVRRSDGWTFCTSVRALAGSGLEGDSHASPYSPRQVLVASQGVYESLALAPMALGENVLLDCAPGALTSGRRVRLGEDAEIMIMFACEPCGKLDRVRTGLASAVRQGRGALARVTRSGTLRVGAPVQLLATPAGALAPLLSDVWQERVREVVRRVPPQQWVSYAKLAELAGVSSSHCRAFPRLLSTFAEGARAAPASAAHERGPSWEGVGLYD